MVRLAGLAGGTGWNGPTGWRTGLRFRRPGTGSCVPGVLGRGMAGLVLGVVVRRAGPAGQADHRDERYRQQRQEHQEGGDAIIQED